MKKQTNITALKELVNNNVLEIVRLCLIGIQAYNIAEGDNNDAQSNDSNETPAATYGAQRTAAALRAARRATIAAAAWLRSSHEFFAQDGDPIRCTGWQLVGFNLAAAAVVVLLSIKY